MKRMIFAAAALMIAMPAVAESLPPKLKRLPNLAKHAEAFPMLVGSSQAIGRINAALRAANALVMQDMRSEGPEDCLQDAPEKGIWWEQDVDAPLLGARFVSFLRHGNESCAGAHPNFIMQALVFDLKTGRKVDWAMLLPAKMLSQVPGHENLDLGEQASPVLTELFTRLTEEENPGECREEFGHQKLTFQLWPDAKAKGLAMYTYSLPQRVQGVCGGPVTIPLKTLKELGVNPELIHDIEAGNPGGLRK